MTAPTFGGEWTGTTGDWNDADNWSGDLPDGGEEVAIGEYADAIVTLDTGSYSIGYLEMFGDATLKLTGDSTLTLTEGGTIGAVTPATLEISGEATFNCLGDLVIGYDGPGTFKIIGSDATIDTGAFTTDNGDDSTLELEMDTFGISTINVGQGTGTDGDINLVVNLDAYYVAGLSSMTLMDIADDGGTQGTFAVEPDAITMAGYAIPLTLGTQGSLDEGEYFIDYAGDADDHDAAGNDVVLWVNVIPVYNGCSAAKVDGENPYERAAADLIGDRNYDCEVNSVDFADMASTWLNEANLVELDAIAFNWLTNKSL
jgi:hypothetical protein